MTRKIVLPLETYDELISAAGQALSWIKGVRQIGDGWDDDTDKRLAKAITEAGRKAERVD